MGFIRRPTLNNGLPLYMFGTDGYVTLTGQQDVAETFLDEINIVPNPYYVGQRRVINYFGVVELCARAAKLRATGAS